MRQREGKRIGGEGEAQAHRGCRNQRNIAADAASSGDQIRQIGDDSERDKREERSGARGVL
jgi:hypothetical protein